MAAVYSAWMASKSTFSFARIALASFIWPVNSSMSAVRTEISPASVPASACCFLDVGFQLHDGSLAVGDVARFLRSCALAELLVCGEFHLLCSFVLLALGEHLIHHRQNLLHRCNLLGCHRGCHKQNKECYCRHHWSCVTVNLLFSLN